MQRIKPAILLAAALVAVPAVAEAEVAKAPDQVRPLLIGAQVPEVTVQTGEGKPFALLDALRKQPTVVIFYRGGW